MWSSLYVGYQVFVLAYFALLNLQYAAFTYLGLRSIVVTAREFSQVALTDFVEHQIYEPVSILVPAYNEQESIVASVDSFLSLNFPEFEVIVVSDGSTDQTIGRLIHAFDLVEHERIRRRIVPTGYVRRVFRSLRHPGLHVIEKDWGGKADALNAGLNLAQYPLICPVDGDSMLDAEAILRSSRLFTEDDTLLAIGGTVRPLNAVATTEGAIEEMRLPRRWIERFQVLEYARAFFTGRAGWSHVGMLLIISGPSACSSARRWKGSAVSWSALWVRTPSSCFVCTSTTVAPALPTGSRSPPTPSAGLRSRPTWDRFVGREPMAAWAAGGAVGPQGHAVQPAVRQGRGSRATVVPSL